MSSRVITFRLDTESKQGQIFEKWEGQGYEPRQIIETALLLLEDLDPPPFYEMSDNVINDLRGLVERLENVSKQLVGDSAALTVAQQQVIDDVLNPKFMESMKKIVRPGFKTKPKDNG